MGQLHEYLDLGELGIGSGESRTLDLDISMDSFLSGGIKYEAVPKNTPTLDISRTVSGWVLKLSYVVDVKGPCSRCLTDASIPIEIVTTEVDQPNEVEEMSSPYVEEDQLEIQSWAQAALIFKMPSKVLCQKGCRGLCSVCGANLNTNDPADHTHNKGDDPRWAKLKQIKFE